jgi:hypothetical protein
MHTQMFRCWFQQSKWQPCLRRATEEQCSVVRVLWANRLNAKNTHKEMFPVYSGKRLSCKVVHNCVDKLS